MPRTRVRKEYKQLTDFEKGRIVGLHEAGWSTRRIGTHVGRDNTTVQRCVQKWFRESTHTRKVGTGARRVTSQRDDRLIRRQVLATPTATLSTVRRAVITAISRPITRQTISNRLAEVGLHARRPLRCLPLTSTHRRLRLEWCRSRATWSAEWRHVVFSDESRFCLGSDNGRIHIWRRRGERDNPDNCVERHTARTQGVMVWGSISYDSRSSLVCIAGNLTARRYVAEILEPVAIPFTAGVNSALFQQDNARPHTANISRECLRGTNILPWPARSPDLSPIENVWDTMGRHLQAQTQPAQTTAALLQQVETAWLAVPQDSIRHLYDSMPRRVAKCITHKGGAIPY